MAISKGEKPYAMRNLTIQPPPSPPALRSMLSWTANSTFSNDANGEGRLKKRLFHNIAYRWRVVKKLRNVREKVIGW